MTDDVRTALNTYATEDPADGDYGKVTREGLAPAVFEALRRVMVVADDFEKLAAFHRRAGTAGSHGRTVAFEVAADEIRAAVSASLAPEED